MALSTPGYWTLTATMRPSGMTARWTWPMDAAATGTGDQSRNRDRKSTRLNSSHDQISYAVFCLKKKKHGNGGRRGVRHVRAEGSARRGRHHRAVQLLVDVPRLSCRPVTASCQLDPDDRRRGQSH